MAVTFPWSLTRLRRLLSLRDLLMVLLGMCISSLAFVGNLLLLMDGDHPIANADYEYLQQQHKTVPKLPVDGWRSIHVYYGSTNLLTDGIKEQRAGWPGSRSQVWGSANDTFGDASVRWYGEHGQDVAIAKFFKFKRGGYFVDLAAHQAAMNSNTYALERHYGWEGLCIEPNPKFWFELSMRKNCHVLGTVVGPRNLDQIKFRLDENAPGVAGIVGDRFDNKERSAAETTGSGNDLKRYTASLSDILDMFDAPKTIDFLSLDVEGAETFIMKGFPFDRYTIKALTIERPDEGLRELLQSQGYSVVYNFRRGDTLWAHSSVYNEGKARIEIDEEDIKLHQVKNLPALDASYTL